MIFNISSALFICLALWVATLSGIPVDYVEPSILSQLAIAGIPFNWPTPIHEPTTRFNDGLYTPAVRILMATPVLSPTLIFTPPVPTPTTPAQQIGPIDPQQTSASIPVRTIIVTTTQAPVPLPSYTYEETHNDSKNTTTNGIIAAIAFGSIFGVLALFIMVPCIAWHKAIKPWYRNRNDGKDLESSKSSFSSGESVHGRSAVHTTRQENTEASMVPQPLAPACQLRANVARDADGFFHVVPRYDDNNRI